MASLRQICWIERSCRFFGHCDGRGLELSWWVHTVPCFEPLFVPQFCLRRFFLMSNRCKADYTSCAHSKFVVRMELVVSS